MNYPHAVRIAVFAAAVGAGVAFAQTADPAGVVTDTAPPPAEDRSSVGAVVLQTSPVPAQRALIAERAASQAATGRLILRETVRAQQEADEAADTRRMGAPPATLPAVPQR